MSNILEVLAQNIIVDKDKCVFCGKCVDVCIIDNLRMKLAPCRKACPLGLNCQGYAQLIGRGEEEKALEMIGEKLPFPGILGRICHQPCEAECKRNEVDGSGVSLRILKRYLADNHELIIKDMLPKEELKEKVAVIGGGPAGMMAAYSLRTKGYQVTIYEAGNKLGGMLVSSIPEYRLPEEVVQRETALLNKMGVHTIYDAKVGKDISFEEIVSNFDAIVVAIGMQSGKKLGLPGEEAQHIYSALDYLKKAKENPKTLHNGNRVLVIGGGNTAINAAQTALRLGASEVRIVCLEHSQNMAAYKWEVVDALEEGIMIEYGWGPDKFITEDNQVKGIVFKKCYSIFDHKDRFAPQYSEGERQTFSADAVIVAVGQEVESELNMGSLELENGFIKTDKVTKQTSLVKVFAAGDVTEGAKTVADAMAQGREAAISLDRYFREIPLGFDRNTLISCDFNFDVDLAKAEMIPRVNTQKICGEERLSFNEIEKGVTKEQALMEAKRCLSCGEPYGKFRTCWSCLPCEVECPYEAISVKIPYFMR